MNLLKKFRNHKMNVAIIQARTNSTRFPNKVLKTINGKSILQHIIEFLELSKSIDKIVVATTDLIDDNPIESLLKKLNVSCFRGSSNDVLKRYYDCAKLYDADVILRVTADDPLIDPVIIDNLIKKCQNSKIDYVTSTIPPTFPLGFTACEAFPFTVLEKLHENALDSMSREHVTSHILENKNLFKISSISSKSDLARPDWRLTIDFPDDFLLIQKIFFKMNIDKKNFSYLKLVEFLDNNLDLLEINNSHKNI